MLRGSWILSLFPYDIVMSGLSEYRIRAADSISPPLAFGGGPGSVSTRILLRSAESRARPPDSGCWILESADGWVCVFAEGLAPPWILDAGSRNLWAVGLGVRARPWILDAGICGQCGPVWARPRILDSGFWILGCRRVEGCGPPADSGFWILNSGLSDRRSTGVGRPDSVFWILEAGVSRVAGPPGFCILHSVFCRHHVHVMHEHGSRDGT